MKRENFTHSSILVNAFYVLIRHAESKRYNVALSEKAIMSEREDILHFLRLIGIEAQILHDDISGKLVSVETAAYEEHHRQIDAWFTVVRQIGKHSYFTIRLRGTGQTL